MLLVIVFSAYYGGIQMPMSMGYYSPPAAIFIRDSADMVILSGLVLNINQTPAVDVGVRLFGTDELVSDLVRTNSMGEFVSNHEFLAGQYIRITFEDCVTAFSIFIPYSTEEVFFLGTFGIAI